MLATACQYASMFSQLKLSALAKLNFLPSWWFFREMAVKTLGGLQEDGGMGRILDDSVMEGLWRDACLWSKGLLEGRAGMQVERSIDVIEL